MQAQRQFGGSNRDARRVFGPSFNPQSAIRNPQSDHP
jgi:hypothetical protein